MVNKYPEAMVRMSSEGLRVIMGDADGNFARLDHRKIDLASPNFYRNTYLYVVLIRLRNMRAELLGFTFQ